MARAARPLAQRGIPEGVGGRGVGGALVVSHGRGLRLERPLRVPQLSEPVHRAPGFPLRAPDGASLCLWLVKVGTDALPIERRSPWLHLHWLATPTPVISSFSRCECLPAPASLALHQLQSAGACLLASGPCTPSTPNSGPLPAFGRPPFRVPPGLCTLSTRNSVSLGAFAHPPLGIPRPSRSLHTLHSEFQTPDTRWGPDSIREGVLGAYQAEMPRLATIAPWRLFLIIQRHRLSCAQLDFFFFFFLS